MNKCVITLLILTGLSITSCSTDSDFRKSELSNKNEHEIKVSFVDLTERINKGKETRSFASKVTPITYERDTVLYLIQNNGGGWALYSGDKRTPAILAYSNNGVFDNTILDSNPNLRYLIDGAARYIFDNQKEETGEINSFWRYNKEKVRELDNQPEPGWRLIFRGDSLVIYDNIPHIIETKWGQEEPWNSCFPYLTMGSSVRSAVGCANVAWGQILYWAHSKYGVPSYMYTEAYCNDYINAPQSYSYHFEDSSSTAWNQMKLTPGTTGNADYVSNLMAKVASLDNTAYTFWYDYSGLNRMAMTPYDSGTFNEISNYFGLSYSSYSAYSKSLVVGNLRNGMPTIVVAHDNNGGQHVNHCWIIDGYSNSKEFIKYYYIWDPFLTYTIPPYEEEEEEEEEPEGGPISHGRYSFVFPEGYQTLTNEWVETQEYFVMNWGWSGQGDEVYCHTVLYEWLVSSYAYDVPSAIIVTGFSLVDLNE